VRINDLEREITLLVKARAPTLLTRRGVGVLTATKLLGETADIARFRNKDAYGRHPAPPHRGPGADNEGTTPSAISHPARPTDTLHIGSSVGHAPGPTNTLRPPSDQRKRPLLSNLLARC